MKFKLIKYTYFLIPFLATFILWIADLRLITQVTGNQGLGLLLSGLIFLYFSIGILLFSSDNFERSVAVFFFVLTSIIFLPVRQNISVVDYVKNENDKIYWIERTYLDGFIRVFESNDSLILTETGVISSDGPIHEAYLKTLPSSRVVFVYKENSADKELTNINLK